MVRWYLETCCPTGSRVERLFQDGSEPPALIHVVSIESLDLGEQTLCTPQISCRCSQTDEDSIGPLAKNARRYLVSYQLA